MDGTRPAHHDSMPLLQPSNSRSAPSACSITTLSLSFVIMSATPCQPVASCSVYWRVLACFLAVLSQSHHPTSTDTHTHANVCAQHTHEYLEP
jgi:hypothetical protein